MTTSGTYGAVNVTVATIIEQAVRKTGKLVSTVSGEVLLEARNDLYFLLLALANRGLSLFCQQKQVYACIPGLVAYPLQAGTVDILRVNSRTSTPILGNAIAGGTWQGADLLAVSNPGSMSVDFAVDVTAKSFVIENSQDQIVWAAVDTFTANGPAGTLVYQDLDKGGAAEFWRIRALDGLMPQVNDLAWHGNLNELPMTPMDRDQYQQLPNKQLAGSRPLQYWYDKQIAPMLDIWPVAPDSAQQLVVWSQRHIQDPGALSGQLAVPARWYDPVIYQLAARVAESLPKGELEPGRLDYLNGKAEQATLLAENGETDGAPTRIMPNLRGYTR